LQHVSEYGPDVCSRAKECWQLKKAMNWTKLLPDGLQKAVILRNISQGVSCLFWIFLT
jgi:hypothetical protein